MKECCKLATCELLTSSSWANGISKSASNSLPPSLAKKIKSNVFTIKYDLVPLLFALLAFSLPHLPIYLFLSLSFSALKAL